MTTLTIATHRVFAVLLTFALMGTIGTLFIPTAQAASKNKPSITLTSPKAKSTFSKTMDGTIPVTWSAKNVPENTLVIVELDHKKLAKGSAIGGGTWQDEIVVGNSIGTHNIDIETLGTADAGTYRVRALLQQCSSKGCEVNPFFPGEKKTKTYAKSKWTNITITKTGRSTNTSSSDSDTDGTVGVVLAVNGSYSDSVTLDASASPSFTYVPSGDVDSCTLIATYTDGSESVKHGWKDEIKAGDYGKAVFNAAGKNGLLRSVQVRCKNSTYEATDTIQVATSNTGVAAYKILIGKTGKEIFKKGTGTEAQARAYCSQAYNDPDIHEYTRVQCYWNNDRFIDQKEFKG